MGGREGKKTTAKCMEAGQVDWMASNLIVRGNHIFAVQEKCMYSQKEVKLTLPVLGWELCTAQHDPNSISNSIARPFGRAILR
jgi:hypothetical protein